MPRGVKGSGAATSAAREAALASVAIPVVESLESFVGKQVSLLPVSRERLDLPMPCKLVALTATEMVVQYSYRRSTFVEVYPRPGYFGCPWAGVRLVVIDGEDGDEGPASGPLFTAPNAAPPLKETKNETVAGAGATATQASPAQATSPSAPAGKAPTPPATAAQTRASAPTRQAAAPAAVTATTAPAATAAKAAPATVVKSPAPAPVSAPAKPVTKAAPVPTKQPAPQDEDDVKPSVDLDAEAAPWPGSVEVVDDDTSVSSPEVVDDDGDSPADDPDDDAVDYDEDPSQD